MARKGVTYFEDKSKSRRCPQAGKGIYRKARYEIYGSPGEGEEGA